MRPYELTKDDQVFIEKFMMFDIVEKKNFWSKFKSDDKELMHKAIKQHYIKEQQYKCAYCQNEILVNHGMVWDIEHIISRDEEPDFTYEPENLCVCCKDCNVNKSNKKITLKNLTKNLPKNENEYAIPHPHFSKYCNHIFKSGFIYSPLSKKGNALISICDLTRFVERKIYGENGFLSIENNELAQVAVESLDKFINGDADYSLLTLKGAVDALVEKKFH